MILRWRRHSDELVAYRTAEQAAIIIRMARVKTVPRSGAFLYFSRSLRSLEMRLAEACPCVQWVS